MDDANLLDTFYDGYMAYIGVDATKVDPDRLTVQDKATLEGLKAVLARREAQSLVFNVVELADNHVEQILAFLRRNRKAIRNTLGIGGPK